MLTLLMHFIEPKYCLFPFYIQGKQLQVVVFTAFSFVILSCDRGSLLKCVIFNLQGVNWYDVHDPLVLLLETWK